MNQDLLPFFDHRGAMSDAEADAVRATLAEDAQLRSWLRQQLAMDDLLSQALQPERGDFVNRVRAMRAKSGDGDRFVARVRTAASQADGRGRRRAPRRRPRHSPMSAWGFAAAAALIAGVVVLWALSEGRPSGHDVLEGSIVVGERTVRHLPEGADFTVTGDDPAVIGFASGSRAEFAPSSAGVIRSSRTAVAPVVRLDSGGGEFQLSKDQKGFRIETSVGTITANGEAAQFTARLEPAPGTDAVADGAPMSTAGRPPLGVGASDVLAVTVKSGSARVEFKGSKHIINADESTVFTHSDGKVSEQHVLRGAFKSLLAQSQGQGPAIVISEHNEQKTIAIGPTTKVHINNVAATLADLRPGEHVEINVARDNPTLAMLIAIKRPLARKPDHLLRPAEPR